MAWGWLIVLIENITLNYFSLLFRLSFFLSTAFDLGITRLEDFFSSSTIGFGNVRYSEGRSIFQHFPLDSANWQFFVLVFSSPFCLSYSTNRLRGHCPVRMCFFCLFLIFPCFSGCSSCFSVSSSPFFLPFSFKYSLVGLRP